MRRATPLLAFVLTALAVPALAQGPVEVRTSLSRTAVWVGDRLTYTVEIRCAPQVDVLADDLAAERLQVLGAEVVESESALEDTERGRIRRMRYTLVSYRVDVSEIRIPQRAVRYFERQAGGDSAQLAPAGEIAIPASVIPIRSTLPDTGAVPPPRAAAGLRHSPRLARLAVPIGIALIALVMAPLVIASADLPRRARRLWASIRARRARRRQRGSLDQLTTLPVGDDNRVEAFGRLEAVVREHLALTAGIPAHALTPEETRQRLEQQGMAPSMADVDEVLVMCENARYGAEAPDAEAWRRALERAETVLRRS